LAFISSMSSLTLLLTNILVLIIAFSRSSNNISMLVQPVFFLDPNSMSVGYSFLYLDIPCYIEFFFSNHFETNNRLFLNWSDWGMAFSLKSVILAWSEFGAWSEFECWSFFWLKNVLKSFIYVRLLPSFFHSFTWAFFCCKFLFYLE